MPSIMMGKDFLMVALLHQWAEENGVLDQLCVFLSDCIQQKKNPFDRKLDEAMTVASKALAAYMPNHNGHGPIQAINGVDAPPEALCTGKVRARFAPAKAKGQENTIFDGEVSAGDYQGHTVDLKRMKRVTGPNIVRAWLQTLTSHAPVTSEDICTVMERNFRGFSLKSNIQKKAAVDNVTYALRNAGIIEWEKKGNHYRRSRFFKTEKIGRKATNTVIQIYLDGGIPCRRGRKIKRRIKLKVRAKA